MQKIRHSGFSKLIVAVVMALMLAPSALAYQVEVAPQVTSHSATPNPYDPTASANFGEVTVSFYVNTDAIATIDILDRNGSAIAANTTVTPLTTAGTYSFRWDGQIGGDYVTAGTYHYRINVENLYGEDTVTGPIVVEYDEVTCEAPEITNDYATPSSFDPDEDDTRIYYTLNTAADVTVTIRDGSTTIANLGTTSRNAGTYYSTWSGSGADEGVYTYRIAASTSSCGDAVQTGSVEVEEDADQSGAAPRITNDYATPNPFDPDEESTRIYFTLSDDADVTLDILDADDDVIRTLVDDAARSEGTQSFLWNGDDEDGDQVSDDTYTYRIRASNSDGSDTETGTVTVDSDGSTSDDEFEDDIGDLISNVEVEDALFNPEDSERARLTWDVEEDNVDITVTIIDEDEDLVREIIENREYDEVNNTSVYWNGRDEDNDIVNDDLYLFKIEAEKGSENEVAYRWLEVDTDGEIIGFPDSDDYCAGFTDVSEDNPYCKAIELMKIKGIFTGYEDGTFRLYSPINRAETVKVVLLAIDRYDLMSDNGTNLGFWDVTRGAWYMPYLRTAQNYGIIDGYPDGSFRPNIVPNKVELLKIFLEGTGINIPYCNVAPYADTPVTSETRWYIDYVCFAADHGLISADANNEFHPNQAMTRGDVAMVFYNFYVRGLYRQTPYYTGYSYSTYGYPYAYDSYGAYDYTY